MPVKPKSLIKPVLFLPKIIKAETNRQKFCENLLTLKKVKRTRWQRQNVKKDLDLKTGIRDFQQL